MPVPLPTDPKQTCVCGRWNNKIHCPGCGSYTVLGLGVKHNKAMEFNGKTVIVPSFKCRRCSLTFDDYEWRYKCEAPRYESASMLQKRTVEQAQEHFAQAMADAKLRGEDAVAAERRRILENLFKNKQPAVKAEPNPLDFDPDKQD